MTQPTDREIALEALARLIDTAGDTLFGAWMLADALGSPLAPQLHRAALRLAALAERAEALAEQAAAERPPLTPYRPDGG